MRFCASILAVLVCAGCGEEETDCTTEARAGLNVTVLDGGTGDIICDASVIATDGDYTEALSSAGVAGDCAYVGAWEREGTYTVEASGDVFQSASQDGIVVPKGECHVQGQTVTLTLTPL